MEVWRRVTQVSSHSADAPGLTRPAERQAAPGPLDGGNGPVERLMSTLIRKLAWSRLSNPKVAVSLSAAGLLLGMLLGATAPNAETLPVLLPLSRLLPSLGSQHVLASLMLYTSISLACLGLAGMLWAHSQGWRPNPRVLLLISTGIVAIMVCLTPVGSSDTASYAAYGRIAALGGNPYTSNPLAFLGAHSPYTMVVGTMWKAQPSVYGPFATIIQSFAASIGLGNVATTIWVLMILNGIVFLGVGLLLLLTSDDPVRATLFWTANPVLILELVSGGHLDTLVAAAAIGAIQVARRFTGIWGDVVVGVLIGLACGVKIYAVLIGLGLAFALLRNRDWKRITRMTVAAVATLVLSYSYYGLGAMKTGVRRAQARHPALALAGVRAHRAGLRGPAEHHGHDHQLPVAVRAVHRGLADLPADLLRPAGRGGGAVRADVRLDPRRPVGLRLVHRSGLGRADPGAA